MESQSDVPLITERPEKRGGCRVLEVAKDVWDESKKLWVVAGPAAFTRLTFYGMTVVSQAFAGHVGDLELAAFSIAATVISGLSFGFFVGMASAVETLCGQAYGAKQYRMMGIYLQRSWLIILGVAVLLTPTYIFSGQPADVHLHVHCAGPARRAVAPGGPGQHVHAPAALRLRHHPAAQQVPAVPAQELGRRGGHGGGVPRARRGDLAAGALLPAWGLRSRDGAQPVLGPRDGGADILCLRRRMPGDVEGILGVGVRGLEGLRQVVCGVRRHDLLGELVLPDISFPDGIHDERRTGCGCSVHLFKLCWMGDDDSFGILSRHWGEGG